MILELLPGFHAHHHRFLWHAPTSTAILADLHLGFESALADSAGIAPDFSDFTRQWRSIVQQSPKRVILAGDIFHKAILASESIDLLNSWFAMLKPKTEVILIPGNHDPAMRDLRQLFGNRLAVSKSFSTNFFTVAHGHDLESIAETCNRPLIVGHQHPAVLLEDRIQSAKMICYAWTKKLIILPTFSPMPIGVSLFNSRKWILDLPVPSENDIQIAGIIRDKVLKFGYLSDLKL